LDGYVVQAQADRYDRPMLPSTAPPNPAPPTGTGGGQDVTSPTAWPGVSLGAYDPSAATWHLSTQNAQGVPDIAPFAYGAPGWSPVAGDWGGTGRLGIGMFDPATATWYLRNEASPGFADAGVFRYGAPGWVPVVGDWGGTGHSGVGV